MAVATDVPDKYDVVINAQGYTYAPSDAGLPPSVFGVKTEFGYTPTFITRQNTQGDYGDNQQDFWLTYSQRDWSLGEQQRYVRPNDAESARRYWQGVSVNPVTEPGQVSMRRAVSTITYAAVPVVMTAQASTDNVWFATSTNLYQVANTGTITDRGAHGLGVAPQGITTDVADVYLAGTGASLVRKWDGGAFSSFSTTSPAQHLVYLNNTLYGFRYTANDFARFDTAGTATSLFVWKNADGTIPAGSCLGMAAYGGKILFLILADNRFELWIYDGTGVSKLHEWTPNFVAKKIIVAQGLVFISGYTISELNQLRPTIFYWSNGTVGLLWESKTTTTTANFPVTPMTPWQDGIAFVDDARSQVMFYSASLGGVHSLGPVSVPTSAVAFLAGANTFMLWAAGSVTGQRLPTSTTATTATITTSLADFDSSLTKLFRGIRVEFDPATDGNGGTVDIAYRVGDVAGAYTTLQTGATSGTEYTLTGITGRSISVKVTLNKGTSTAGPVLKRISVRAAPQQTQFRQGQYVLYLGGKSKRDPLEGQLQQLRDGSINPKDGKDQIADLVTAATSISPIAITDPVNGTMSSCLIDLASTKFTVAGGRTNEFIALVSWKEV